MKRRRYLSAVSLGVAGALGGCLGVTDSADGDSNGRGERRTGRIRPTVEIREVFDGADDGRFSIDSFDGTVGATDRGRIDIDSPDLGYLAVTNAAAEARTFEFEGFVPLADPRASPERESSGRELLVVPAPVHRPECGVNGGVADYDRIGDYWEVASPVERPTATTVTLEPDEAISVRHDLVAADGHLSEGDASGLESGEYRFESPISIQKSKGTATAVTVGFTLEISSGAV